MDTYEQYIALSRYSRWLEDENRRETWAETVGRYVTEIAAPVLKDKPLEQDLYRAIYRREVMPSMRAMMTAGPAAHRDNTCVYNCAYLPLESKTAFAELMYILLCGTGVGFSVERQFIASLPEVPVLKKYENITIGVEDSKEGWADALNTLIYWMYEGCVVSWDLSKVRPAGARLKTFGGRASGPQPLDDLLNFVVETFTKAQGRKLTSLECHDIACKIGDVVVVGGVRRSAMISLSNLSDDRMRHAKSGQWWIDHPYRALANNSAVYTDKPDAETFLREWSSLVESKSGERGIFNRQAAIKQVESIGRRDPGFEFGTNPCCFTGDMRLLTTEGYATFQELSKRPYVRIVSNDGTVTEGKVWSSGVKPTVHVNWEASLSRRNIQCTEDHIFMLTDGSECMAKDLKGKQPMPFIEEAKAEMGDEKFLAGFMLGDAGLSRLSSCDHLGLEVFFNMEKDYEIAEAWNADVKSNTWYSRHAAQVARDFGLPSAKIGERGLPEKLSSLVCLQGLYSANGSVIKAGRVALKTVDKLQADRLVDFLKRLYQIEAYITVNKATLNKFSNGAYLCKESYDVNISRYASLLKFSKLINFGQTYKRKALKEMLLNRAPKVRSVVQGTEQEVFDFTEPKNNWGIVEEVVVHNSEIILRPRQFCNLTECVVRSDDTYESLRKKVKLATILGTVQATYTHFPYLEKLNPDWKANTEEERLLGVSMTGIMDCQLTSIPNGLPDLLVNLKKTAIAVNKEWSQRLGINQSAAITCVKPSGTVSQLVNSASGIHPRHSQYYIRTVRGDNKDPLTQYMQSVGFPYEPCVNNPENVSVFSFPVASPEGCITRDNLTALEQLELWLTYQKYWCEHKPSITVTVRDHEWIEVANFVYNNFDYMTGVSFLPHSDHVYKQAPYQEINYAQYVELSDRMPRGIDWSGLRDFERYDSTKSSQTFACSGPEGTCEIVDI